MSYYLLRGLSCTPQPNRYYDMWQRKKTQYYQCTSTAVSFFQIKKIYCVTFVSTSKWFDSLEEAEFYKAYLYELFFFDLELDCSKETISIKEYYIPNMFRI